MAATITEKLFTYKLEILGPPCYGEIEQMVVVDCGEAIYSGSTPEAFALREVDKVADIIRQTGADVVVTLRSVEAF
jgi:hypothetical protein